MRALAALLLIAFAFAARGESIDLAGSHPTMAGDDPVWAAAEFDDAAWSSLPAPALADWEAQGGAAEGTVRWSRIRFTAPAAPYSRPALLLGVVSGADRVFLDGVEIGASANIDDPRLQERTANWSKAWPRLYRFDAALLRPGESHVLAIRFARAVRNNAAILSGPVLIGDYGELVDLAAEAARPHRIVAGFLLSAYALLALGLLVALELGVRDRAVIVFALIYVGPCLAMLYLSPVTRATGFALDPWVEVYIQRLRPFGTIMLLDFVALALRRPVPVAARAAQVAAVFLLLVPPLADGGLLEATRNERFAFVLAVMLGLLLTMSLWSLRAARAGDPVGWPLSIGFALFFAGLGVEFLIDRNFIIAETGHGASDFGVSAFLFSLAVAAGRSHLEAQRRLTEAQAGILTAQEEERRRLARDVHDGVGQWLQTIKLSLQMLTRDAEAPLKPAARLGEVVSQVEEAIADTRRIAHDLSPAMIERGGLAAALRSHADRLSAASSAEVIVEAVDFPGLSGAAQGHLLRIAQEAARNALEHGGAGTIRIALSARNGRARLSIEDDGAGMSPGAEPGGLGLRSIRESAELLGATCRIVAGGTGGCLVEVTLPRVVSG